ncbi:MAG TPA: U32 family peptidase, partial [Candidatus Methylacidiphilales bacterium]|nr:U32 family peptidase [Candidatus Methylacidiphilales bacterium]
MILTKSSQAGIGPKKPELLAPAGDWDCAKAAVANGADAIYFGLPAFNARMRATNFTPEDLPKLIDFLHSHNVKGYVAFNVLIFTDELPAAEEELRQLANAGVDAAIVQDLGLVSLAREVAPDLHIHASTQMTLTSPEGVAFARKLGVSQAVLARELSLRELAKFREESVPLEVFVHGALCVAYSGQCLTSEALGQRSANRGECAQACRLPYELIVDGVKRDLGDKRYLLSPQDLAAVQEIPELIRLGIASFKIEGRLKTPEYVSAVTQVYRRAIDEAWHSLGGPDNLLSGLPEATGGSREDSTTKPADRYKLEMAFSRGLYSGWMHGVNHQELVHARYGKKRGAFIGDVTAVGRDYFDVQIGETPVHPGDGIVIDQGKDTDREQGGRIFHADVQGKGVMRLAFEHGKINFSAVHAGDRIWKTDDPQLNRELRKSWSGDIPLPKRELDFLVTGRAGKPLRLEARCGDASAAMESSMPLAVAQKRPLNDETLRTQLGRLGETDFELSTLENRLEGDVILPVSELNRLRRDVAQSVAAVYDRRTQHEKGSVGGHRPPLQTARDRLEI